MDLLRFAVPKSVEQTWAAWSESGPQEMGVGGWGVESNLSAGSWLQPLPRSSPPMLSPSQVPMSAKLGHWFPNCSGKEAGWGLCKLALLAPSQLSPQLCKCALQQHHAALKDCALNDSGQIQECPWVCCISPMLSWKCHKALLSQHKARCVVPGSCVDTVALEQADGKPPLCWISATWRAFLRGRERGRGRTGRGENIPVGGYAQGGGVEFGIFRRASPSEQ